MLLGKVLAQGDIFADRGVEKEHVLLDVAHLLLQLLGGVVFGVLTVKSDGPLVVREPAEEELQQRTLAAAGGAGEGVFAALLEAEGHAVQDRLLAVAEGEVLHCDGLPDRRQALRALGGQVLRVDGDLVEVGFGGGEGKAACCKAVQSVGDAAGKRSAAADGGQRKASLHCQYNDQDVCRELRGYIDIP